MAQIRRFALAAALAGLATSFGTSAALDELVPSGPQLTIDLPGDGAQVTMGDRLFVGGWAAGGADSGTGIAEIGLYLDGAPGSGGIPIGKATYGSSRPDVASRLGRPDWARSGFGFDWIVPRVQPGPHVLYVQARGAAGAVTTRTVTVVLERSTCTPAHPCMRRGDLGGWIIDDGGPILHFESEIEPGGMD